MSSSPQISRQDSISNSLPSFSKINTSSASASVGVSASANSAYKVPAQEETVCQKETVRISPPLYQKEIPVSTYYTNGHLKNSRYVTHRLLAMKEFWLEKTYFCVEISKSLYRVQSRINLPPLLYFLADIFGHISRLPLIFNGAG